MKAYFVSCILWSTVITGFGQNSEVKHMDSATTQKLNEHKDIPRSDSVVWVDSIGMRSPALNRKDIGRVFEKLGSMLQGSAAAANTANSTRLT